MSQLASQHYHGASAFYFTKDQVRFSAISFECACQDDETEDPTSVHWLTEDSAFEAAKERCGKLTDMMNSLLESAEALQSLLEEGAGDKEETQNGG